MALKHLNRTQEEIYSLVQRDVPEFMEQHLPKCKEAYQFLMVEFLDGDIGKVWGFDTLSDDAVGKRLK